MRNGLQVGNKNHCYLKRAQTIAPLVSVCVCVSTQGVVISRKVKKAILRKVTLVLERWVWLVFFVRPLSSGSFLPRGKQDPIVICSRFKGIKYHFVLGRPTRTCRVCPIFAHFWAMDRELVAGSTGMRGEWGIFVRTFKKGADGIRTNISESTFFYTFCFEENVLGVYAVGWKMAQQWNIFVSQFRAYCCGKYSAPFYKHKAIEAFWITIKLNFYLKFL